MLMRTTSLLILSALMLPDVSLAAKRPKTYCPPKPSGICPPACKPVCPPVCPPVEDDATHKDDDKASDDMATEVPTDTPMPEPEENPFEPITNNFNTNTPQIASTQSTSSPNMIGDFLSPPFGIILPEPSGPPSPVPVVVAYGPPAGATRLQIGQNNSPIPRDRVAVTYNHFHNAYQIQDSVGNFVDANLDLYTTQFEKTFNNGKSSFELRIPFYSAPDNTQTLENGRNDIDGYSMEFGNVSAILKTILFQDCCKTVTMSSGIGITTPTGADTVLSGDTTLVVPQTTQIRIENQSIKLTPFFATLLKPNDQLFTQFFVQGDFAVTGDDFSYVNGATTVNGDLNDQHLLKLDWQVGYWLKGNSCYGCTGCCDDFCCGDSCCDDGCCGGCCGGGGLIKNIAAIFELHYTTTMNDADIITVTDPGLNPPGIAQFGNTYHRVDVLNATVGCTTLIGDRGALTTAVTLPLNEITSDTRIFDHELVLQYNHYLY